MIAIAHCPLPTLQNISSFLPFVSLREVCPDTPHFTGNIFTMTFRSWLGLALFVTVAIRFLSFRYTYGLRRFKGPLLASFTNAWKMFYCWRNTEIPLRDLHDRYGDVVRTGPNALSFRDPQAIRDIFGAGKNWAKVRTIQARWLNGVPTRILIVVLSFEVRHLLRQRGSLQGRTYTDPVLKSRPNMAQERQKGHESFLHSNSDIDIRTCRGEDY